MARATVAEGTAARLADELAPEFNRVYWRSLNNALIRCSSPAPTRAATAMDARLVWQQRHR
jgi:hypothetical protein